MTDITKYKSVAINIDTYKRARVTADKNYMSIASFLRYLIDKEENKPRVIANNFSVYSGSTA